jgi:hypothetical protein
MKKRVISMSLYGQDLKYLNGAIFNSKLYKNIFPGWEYRIYHEHGISQKHLQILKDDGVNLIDMKDSKIVGSLWRFLVYDDDDVEYFICRDIDDRINEYDYEMVMEWIDSNIPFHITRTTPGHTDLILAGLWGGISKFLPNFSMENKIENFKFKSNEKHEDQIFLREVFYPIIKDIHLVHGPYNYYNSKNSKPFPKEMYNNNNEIYYPVGGSYKHNEEHFKL